APPSHCSAGGSVWPSPHAVAWHEQVGSQMLPLPTAPHGMPGGSHCSLPAITPSPHCVTSVVVVVTVVLVVVVSVVDVRVLTDVVVVLDVVAVLVVMGAVVVDVVPGSDVVVVVDAVTTVVVVVVGQRSVTIWPPSVVTTGATQLSSTRLWGD